jgi:hypothetical protein
VCSPYCGDVAKDVTEQFQQPSQLSAVDGVAEQLGLILITKGTLEANFRLLAEGATVLLGGVIESRL